MSPAEIVARDDLTPRSPLSALCDEVVNYCRGVDNVLSLAVRLGWSLWLADASTGRSGQPGHIFVMLASDAPVEQYRENWAQPELVTEPIHSFGQSDQLHIAMAIALFRGVHLRLASAADIAAHRELFGAARSTSPARPR